MPFGNMCLRASASPTTASGLPSTKAQQESKHKCAWQPNSLTVMQDAFGIFGWHAHLSLGSHSALVDSKPEVFVGLI